MIDKHRDTISGVIMLVLASAYFAGSFSIQQYGDASVDSRFFPQILGMALIVLSALQVVFSVKNGGNLHHAKTADSEDKATRFNLGVVLTLLLILVYILLIGKLGFVLSSILYLIAQTTLLAPDKKKGLIVTAVVAVAFSFTVYAIFVYGFSLSLPEGIFR